MINTKDMNTWWYYYNQYKTLVDKLINEDRSLISYNLFSLPFLYCLRHTIELGLKASIYDLSEDENYFKGQNHNLATLFDNFKELLLSRIESLSRSESVGVVEESKLTLKSRIDSLSDFVSIFVQLDEYSQSFRYPTDKKGQASFKGTPMLDDEKIITLYKNTIKLLSHVTSVFCDKYLFAYEDDESFFCESDEM